MSESSCEREDWPAKKTLFRSVSLYRGPTASNRRQPSAPCSVSLAAAQRSATGDIYFPAVPCHGQEKKKTFKRTKCFTPQVLGISSTKAAATAGRYATAVAHTLPCQAYAPVLPARLTSGYVERRLTHRREAAEAMLAVLSSDVGHQTTIGLLLRAEVRTWPKLTTRVQARRRGLAAGICCTAVLATLAFCRHA